MMTQYLHRTLWGRTHRKAMTLAELLIAATIITMAGLSIVASIQTGILFQQSIREENGATRAAADIIDRTRRELFFRLQSFDEEVVVDDRGTERTDDDILGTAVIRFYAPDANGNYFDANGQYLQEVGIPGSPIPFDLSMLMVDVTVTWNRIGRLSNTEREVMLSTLLAP
jgi:type II secretory pathway pseudopilin PulG